MTRGRLERVHAASLRVALATAAIVAVVYAVIAVVVLVIVTRNLTSEIDGRLASALNRLAADPFRPLPTQGYRASGARPFGPPLLAWTVLPNGGVTSRDTSATLPADSRNVQEPTTISVGGTDVRVRGAAIGDAYVVVGQTMESVSEARSNLVTAEAIVGPILLAAVFLGALTIGRRVGAPIELARQRQMDFEAVAEHQNPVVGVNLDIAVRLCLFAVAHQRRVLLYRARSRQRALSRNRHSGV